jgi:hemerythrin-like metal-binding protein
MSPFTWNDSYSVGNDEIDGHHRILFDIVSRLYDKATAIDDLQAFKAILNELDDYSKYHFKAEESLMRKVDYYDIEKHIYMHNYFIARVDDITRRIAKGNVDACQEIIFFIGNWLKHHVIEEDKRITACK